MSEEVYRDFWMDPIETGNFTLNVTIWLNMNFINGQRQRHSNFQFCNLFCLFFCLFYFFFFFIFYVFFFLSKKIQTDFQLKSGIVRELWLSSK